MGNMESCCQKRQQKWVHPCIRGEYNLLGQAPAGGKGSPPHPRGILMLPHISWLPFRFTPASAGNIVVSAGQCCQAQVHPRIRGEYERNSTVPRLISGSPPHPQGIFLISHFLVVCCRFTPASAGNMCISSLFK